MFSSPLNTLVVLTELAPVSHFDEVHFLPCRAQTGHSILDAVQQLLKLGGMEITSLGLLATLTNTAQDTVGRLCCKGTLLLVFNLLFIRTPKSFTAEHLPGQLAPSLYCCRVTPSQMEGLKLAFGEYLKNPVSPFFQPGQVPLNSSLALLHFDHSSPFGLIHKIAS